jgi:hypothetical protein
MTTRRALTAFAMIWGLALVGIGAAHLAFGNASFIDGGHVSPSLDSEERFFAALTIGYGAAYIWAARQTVVPRNVLRALAAVTALGALGRVVSLIDRGPPHWFFLWFGILGEAVAAALTYWLATIGDTETVEVERSEALGERP